MAKCIILGGLFYRHVENIKMSNKTVIKRGISDRWYIIPNDAFLEGL